MSESSTNNTRRRTGRRSPFRFLLAAALVALAAFLTGAVGVGAAGTAGAQYSVGGWELWELVDSQPACSTVAYAKQALSRSDCAYGYAYISPATAGKPVKVEIVDTGGMVVSTQNLTTDAAGRVTYDVIPGQNWQPGNVTVRGTVGAPDSGSGETQFVLNPLEASVSATKSAFGPGEPVSVSGVVNELDIVTCCVDNRKNVPATVTATLHTADGRQLGAPVTVTANDQGAYTLSFPGSATAGLQATAETDFELNLGVRVRATYNDSTPFVGTDAQPKTSGLWLGETSGAAVVRTPPQSLLLRNLFVSSLGWVKPGQKYPFRVVVENHTTHAATNARVTIPAPTGVTFSSARPLNGGSAATTASTVTWTLASVPAGTAEGPTVRTLVVQATANNLAQDPRLAWKDLSSTATLTYDGYTGPALTSKSHGPKVIPPSGGFETARYGDKPFPIVPVDFRDRTHETRHSGDALARQVNAKDVPGSTYNLYQEMSYGQLFPFGDVPSSGIASAGFDYAPGFDFSETVLVRPDNTPGDCRGTTLGGDTAKAVWGTPLYPERIHDGWYQLPGDTEYYGGDYPAFTATSAPPAQIDSACGPIGKGVYDAAQIADPEIDYNDFDSDKDGVVDFFMMVFTGLGGNGDSQLNGVPPYDNIWPHSSSLEYYFTDPVTGLPGYTSDDQLTDLEGTPQCWTSESYSTSADCAANGGTGRDDLPVHVRVGPYNVNPESAIDYASVISHEYGHHLGLPDYYSTSYSAYNDWNLMAGDYSQHMTVFSKQDLGWVVPQFLQPGESVQVNDWEEVKNDTGRIDWQTPSGQPYTLAAANGDQGIHNGETYGLKLPGRIVIPANEVPSGQYLWWSERGNDFGCTPEGGHNLDIALPQLASLAPGTSVKVSFKSRWDIEWDFDYGFTLVMTDGESYTSLPSAKGYTTSMATNPNQSSCLSRLDNGLTGTSASAQAGTQPVDRVRGLYASPNPFVDDEYDLSAYAGQSGVVLRFSYYTDPGLDRPGWFIDDLEVTNGSGDVLYSTDFESEDELHVLPGGCAENGVKTADRCTAGFVRLQGGAKSSQDHGYYLELRDRSGFDYDSMGEADRGTLKWFPGVLVEYTDEVRGYGNNGGGMPPRQHYIDSQPQPGYDCGDNIYETDPEPGALTDPRCEDAAFTAAPGDNHFRDLGWVDNFADDSSDDGLWHFDYGCLTLDVLRMSGDSGNSAALPSDLSADAVITAGEGCAPYEYGRGETTNATPTAVAAAKPETAGTGETVTLDGSNSSDDRQAPEELAYQWDVDGNGSFDKSGQIVTNAYSTPGTYHVKLKVTDGDGASDEDVVDVVVTAPPADLQVTSLSAGNNKAREGDKVTITATVTNAGRSDAIASKTEFLLDGSTVLGVVDTPAIPVGGTRQVSIQWDTRSVKGDHSIRATADKTGLVTESNEGNNAGTLAVSVKGNKVKNGSFEQSNSSASGPEAWSGSSTGGGSATWSEGGSDGSKSATVTGNGGSAALFGAPGWTSAPVAVTPGETLDLVASVKATGLSSAPTLGLAFLDSAGQLLQTVTALTAPLNSTGFQTLEKTVTVPAGVAEVRLVLSGFSALDPSTRGSVTFDGVGLFAH